MKNMEPGYQPDSDLNADRKRLAKDSRSSDNSDEHADLLKVPTAPFSINIGAQGRSSANNQSEASFLSKPPHFQLGEGSAATPLMRSLDMRAPHQSAQPQPAMHPTPTNEDFEPKLTLSSEPKTKAKRKSISLISEVLILAILAMLFTYGIMGYVAQVYEIRGDSMQPTLQDGQKVMINQLTPDINDLHIGDIVIFSDPHNSDRDLIKRIIALPGDRVDIDSDQVTVNGEILVENYIHRGGRQRHLIRKDELVGNNELWVMGDNRGNSKDSRDFGPIQLSTIKGRVFIRLWPFDEITSF